MQVLVVFILANNTNINDKSSPDAHFKVGEIAVDMVQCLVNLVKGMFNIKSNIQ